MNLPGSTTDLKDSIHKYTKHWKWFAFSAIIALVLAYINIRYTQPQYEVQAQIQIVQEKNAPSDLSLFQDLDIFSGGTNQVQDEIEIISSRSNLIEVVQKLGTNVTITALGNIMNTELYEKPPFKINFIVPDSVLQNAKFEFFVEFTTDTSFGYSELEDDPLKVYPFGKNISTQIGEVVITPSIGSPKGYAGNRYKVEIKPIGDVAQVYKKNILITASEEFSNILNISMQSPLPKKANDIINTLITIYNKNAVDDKKRIADRTSDFINNRIADIYTDLASVDQSAQDFKTDRGLTDIASEANINLNVGAATQQELQNVTTQFNIASSMKDIVDNEKGYELLPSNVGLSDASIASTTAQYNQLVLERERLLKSSNEKNPIITNLDQEIANLRQNMQASLSSMTNNLGLQVNSLSQRNSQINSKIYSSPRNERALRDITRQQQTTESLYLYLLQKREESQIAYASAAPKSNIIDKAYKASPDPVTPKKSINYLAAFILGLLVPFSIIYANDLLDTKIHNKIELEKRVKDIPVLAELPRLNKKAEILIRNEDRSVLSESLRILRTNLDYLIRSKKGGRNNVIFVTSSVSGEGKTFLASNLAMIFSNTDKKVLLMGADIRNPKLYSFFSGKDVDKLSRQQRNKDAGLTEFLYDDSLTSKDIINPMLAHTNTIDVIYSGKIPPNPSELLMSERMQELLMEVSLKYDYVIVDTAPLMVVTDTLLISEYADHIIYVTRAGMTENKVIEFPLKLYKEGKLKGLSFVVNGVKDSNLGYGGKYGYGYGKTTKKWWKF